MHASDEVLVGPDHTLDYTLSRDGIVADSHVQHMHASDEVMDVMDGQDHTADYTPSIDGSLLSYCCF